MIDSHAHVNDSAFDADRAEVYARAQAANVVGWIEVGTTLNESEQAIQLAQQYPSVYATVGVHPHHYDDISDKDWDMLSNFAVSQKVVAIGEVGFDFYRGGSLEKQQVVLKRFIDLAQTYKLPIVFHIRNGETIDAHDALIQLLSSYSDTERPRGVIHTYSGTVAQAKQYLDLGLYISFSGVITFKNAGELISVAQYIPSDRMLIETDCPYLTPDPYRGKRNEPAYVYLVAQRLAEIRDMSVEDVMKQTEQNTRALFQIDSLER